jgi:hypothetical protein
VNPYELLAQRHREYAKAQDRHARALEKQAAAQERLQALERELADAEDADRRTLGEALVDGKKPPAGKTEQARANLAQAKQEAEALAYACERAGQELTNIPPPAVATGYRKPSVTLRPPAPTTRSGSPP